MSTRRSSHPHTTTTAPDPSRAAAARAPRLLTLADAALRLSLSYWGVRDLIVAGQLPSVRLNRRVLIDPADLERLIQRSKG